LTVYVPFARLEVRFTVDELPTHGSLAATANPETFGFGLIFTVKDAGGELVHPLALVTVRVALYVATAAAPGTTSTIGLAGRLPATTSTKPSASAEAL